MTACLCALTLSLLSAAAADLGTTQQFTARDIHEMNPLARPFVEGRGSRGEVVLGAITAGVYLTLARGPDIWHTAAQTVALAVHAVMAFRNVRIGSAHEVPIIVLPVLVVTW
jgi:hypothetical protein